MQVFIVIASKDDYDDPYGDNSYDEVVGVYATIDEALKRQEEVDGAPNVFGTEITAWTVGKSEGDDLPDNHVTFHSMQ